MFAKKLSSPYYAEIITLYIIFQLQELWRSSGGISVADLFVKPEQSKEGGVCLVRACVDSLNTGWQAGWSTVVCQSGRSS